MVNLILRRRCCRQGGRDGLEEDGVHAVAEDPPLAEVELPELVLERERDRLQVLRHLAVHQKPTTPHKSVRAAYKRALKHCASAHPNFKPIFEQMFP